VGNKNSNYKIRMPTATYGGSCEQLHGELDSAVHWS